MYDYLEKIVSQKKYKHVLDVGSADFKLLPMFDCEKYTGLDKNIQSLRLGMEKFQVPETNFLEVDFELQKQIGINHIYDLIVCTYLFHWLSDFGKKQALDYMHAVSDSETEIFLQMSKRNYNKIIDSSIRANFRIMDIFEYRNFLSRFIEKLFFDSKISKNRIVIVLCKIIFRPILIKFEILSKYKLLNSSEILIYLKRM